MTQNPKIYDYSGIALYERTHSHWPFGRVYVPSDIYSVTLDLKGRDVLFVCGSDEHGVAISMKAKKKELHRKK
jgi:methionyl-tRNA synthetase